MIFRCSGMARTCGNVIGTYPLRTSDASKAQTEAYLATASESISTLSSRTSNSGGSSAKTIARLERSANPGEEGKKIWIELIQRIREVRGVAGVHVMAYRREHLVEEIIEESGILKERRAARTAGEDVEPDRVPQPPANT